MAEHFQWLEEDKPRCTEERHGECDEPQEQKPDYGNHKVLQELP
eukprot:CAMPEP_0117656504 /NCGR_PEP_ID=MMETSP0804-20121206/4841_1 /TAXON_ID=1074897 /ORGANISM="Tetraselmis astigmatica, Strain CCMP880" /LENGTH=43 /DNA_ID= /DNA_START= /DNA_END= /DNA_ORIENTATION=